MAGAFPIAVNRKNGSKGGRATAKAFSKEWREHRAHVAGTTCLARYGRDFYKTIRAQRNKG